MSFKLFQPNYAGIHTPCPACQTSIVCKDTENYIQARSQYDVGIVRCRYILPYKV